MLTTLINRNTDTGGEWQKIPWHDAEFSRRMLAEHLNQDHNRASRPAKVIDEHVNWIHTKVLGQQTSAILDLGCGPGFYAKRFRALGHTCKGLDISPASIDYAREHDPDGDYISGDIREVEYGEGYDFVSIIFGELNAFAPEDAQTIVMKAHAALKRGGKLLLEVHPYDFIYGIGQEPAFWYTSQKGLFADEPYICLVENTFVVDCAISHFYVFVEGNDAMQQYITMHRAYTDDEYRRLLSAFTHVQFYPSLTGKPTEDLFVIVAEK